MGLPSLNMTFKTLGTTAVTRGTRGVVALLLKDTIQAPLANPIVMASTDDIPSSLTAENQEQIQLAFIGYTNPPKQVIAYVVATDTTDYTAAQNYLETIKWNYFAFPEIADADVAAFATWGKALRSNKDRFVKLVLPNCAGDSETIINYVNVLNRTATKDYTTKEYCGRIAGLLAGTPLNMSATYAPLPELTDCDHLTKDQADAAIDAGKFILINDGRQVKVGRAVNSFVTVTDDKGKVFKKIKIVDIMDQMHEDIKETIEDKYIGKDDNDYDHKVLLISAISGYYDEAELNGLLDKNYNNTVFMDITAQTAYLKSANYTTSDGRGVEDMTAQEIKEANTDDKVFIASKIKITDAMEDISFNVAI